jgi:dCMP deaminase
MENMSWDKYFMTMVYLVAMKSKDKSTKIGAVIVGEDHEILSTGYNGLPRGVNDHTCRSFQTTPAADLVARHERPEKYFYYEHAERNAIFNAARTGIPLKGTTMYTQGIPCSDCGRAVIQAGIKLVIVHEGWEKASGLSDNPKWTESAERTRIMCYEAKVSIESWKGEIQREITGLCDGKVI